jgi:urease accessory protein
MIRINGRGTKPGMMISLALVLTTAADAHLAVDGLGEIGNGMLHPLITPAHALILLGLGLLLGQPVPLDLKSRMKFLAGLSAVALMLAGAGVFPNGVQPPLLVAIALVIGALVALERKPHRHATLALIALAAFGIGLDSGTEPAPLFKVTKTLLGTWICVNVVVAYVAICASHGAEKPWVKVGVRVLGSWILAISLLVLAFSLRK